MSFRGKPAHPGRPEMSLLCACIRPVDAAVRAESLLADSSMDWPVFLDLATSHHVLPLVYRTLRTMAPAAANAVPADVMKRLRDARMAVAANNLRATAVLGRLQAGLAERGIRLVPVKGPALAVLAYGGISMRQFEDLDLLVRRERLLEAVGWLEREGYDLREFPPSADRSRYLATLRDWSLRKPDFPVLDLKPVLISHAVSFPDSVAWMEQSCRPLDAGEAHPLQAPGPEAMFLAVCLDGAGEMWVKLSSVADAAALLAGHPDADWQGLLEQVCCRGHVRSLRTGAQVAERLAGCPLPPAFRDAAVADPRSRRLAEQAAGRLLRLAPRHSVPFRQAWFAFQSRERWRDRWRFVLRVLFIPGVADFAPGRRGHLMQMACRPFRLAWNMIGRGRRPGRKMARSVFHG